LAGARLASIKRPLSIGLLLTGLLSTVTAQADWTAGRGDAQGAAALAWEPTGEIQEWHYIWKTDRRYRTGVAIWASPALALVKGRPVAFIGGCDQTLHALDLLDKRVLWRRMTNAEIGAAPVAGEVGGRTVVFFASNDRTLYALDAMTGVTLWTRELEPASPTLGESSFTSPLLFQGRLYVAGFTYDRSLGRNNQVSRLYCLDPETGQLGWALPIGSGFTSEPVGFAAGGRPCVAVAARRGLLQVFAVEGKAPVRLWTYQMPHEVLGAPAVETNGADPVLVLGSKYGNLIALEAATGRERWKRMAGNWFDNAACIGNVDGTNVVFAGSYDYNVYAIRAADGAVLWKRPLGGEVFSAPAFFTLNGRPTVAVAALDNHVHVLDARSGAILTSYYTGRPVWDKVSKGDTLWGSPAVLEAGDESAVIQGSFNDTVYVLPLVKPCTMQARARSAKSLWLSLGIVALLFTGVVLPWTLTGTRRKMDAVVPRR
jgi:outer membrane protein assembly factor BamB